MERFSENKHTHETFDGLDCSIIYYLRYRAADERPSRMLFDHQRYVEHMIFKFHDLT